LSPQHLLYDLREGRFCRPDIDYPPNDPHYNHREGRFRRPDDPAPHFRYGYGNASPPHAEPYGELVGPPFVQQGANGRRREGDWNNERAHPPNTEPTYVRNNEMSTARKILKAWESDEFKKNLKDTYDCELKDCVIDMKEWLDPLTSDNPETEGCLIDLEPLRRQLAQGPTVISQNSSVFKERFLSLAIYVRQEMKGIFNLFCRDVNLLQQNSSHVDGAVQGETSRIVESFDKKRYCLDLLVWASRLSAFWLLYTVRRVLSRSTFDRQTSAVKMCQSLSCFSKMTRQSVEKCVVCLQGA
jgi:hypothetical protein